MTCHQPELATLFQAADELMADANNLGDTTTCDKLRHYKEDMKERWNSLEEAVTKRRGQLEKALEKAKEFRVASDGCVSDRCIQHCLRELLHAQKVAYSDLYIKLCEKWSGPNRTSRTARAASEPRSWQTIAM